MPAVYSTMHTMQRVARVRLQWLALVSNCTLANLVRAVPAVRASALSHNAHCMPGVNCMHCAAFLLRYGPVLNSAGCAVVLPVRLGDDRNPITGEPTETEWCLRGL